MKIIFILLQRREIDEYMLQNVFSFCLYNEI